MIFELETTSDNNMLIDLQLNYLKGQINNFRNKSCFKLFISI